MTHSENSVITKLGDIEVAHHTRIESSESSATLDVSEPMKVGVVLTQWLVRRGHWTALAETCHVLRKAGAHMLPGMIYFFLLYFSAQATSIKKHSDKINRLKQIGSLVGVVKMGQTLNDSARRSASQATQDANEGNSFFGAACSNMPAHRYG